MPSEPLSEILAVLKPRNLIVGGLDLGGAWSINFDAHAGIKYWAVVSGACTLMIDGIDEPVELIEGDGILLPSGRCYRLATDVSRAPQAFRGLCGLEWRNGVATLNGGGATMIPGGHFVYEGAQADMFLGAMSPAVRLHDDETISLHRGLQRMRQELMQERPGGTLVVQHLAQLMLVQAIRLYLAETADVRPGWLSALAHPKLSRAINAIHAEPGAPWTLGDLAKNAGMSRSSFASCFKTVTGFSPIGYLTRWRMLVAGNRLREGGESISAIAASLSYESEAAFSTAFARVMGHPPRRHGRTMANAVTSRLWQPSDN